MRRHEQQPLVPLRGEITTIPATLLGETTHMMNTVFMTPIMAQAHPDLRQSPMTTLTLILSPASQMMEMGTAARHSTTPETIPTVGVQSDQLV